MPASFYAVLGVEESASAEEIRKAFKRCALASHPDKGGSTSQFQAVLTAFETLVDTDLRAEYSCRLTGFLGEICKIATPSKKRTAESYRSHAPSHTQTRWQKTAASASSSRFPGSSKKKKAKNRKTRHKVPRGLLSRLCNLLRQLGPERRRAVIAQQFSEAQRLSLEGWMLDEQRQQQQQQISLRGDVARPLVGAASVALGKLHSLRQNGADMHLDKQKRRNPIKQWSNACNSIQQPSSQGRERPACISERSHVKRPPSALHPVERHNSKQEKTSRAQCTSGGNGNGKHKPQIHGIASEVIHGQFWYRSSASLGMVHMLSRRVRDLAIAIDFLLVLTTIKQRVFHGPGCAPKNKCIAQSAVGATRGGGVHCIQRSQARCRG